MPCPGASACGWNLAPPFSATRAYRGDFAGLPVDLEVETVGEQVLEERPQGVLRQLVRGPGGGIDVEAGGVEPGGLPFHLEGQNVIGVANQGGQRRVDNDEASAFFKMDLSVVAVAGIAVDGHHFEGWCRLLELWGKVEQAGHNQCRSDWKQKPHGNLATRLQTESCA